MVLTAACALSSGCLRDAGPEGARSDRGQALVEAVAPVPAQIPKVPVEPAQPAAPVVADGGVPAAPSTLSLDGVRERLRRAVGHVLLVHVWASWCAPCLDELPRYDRVAEAARARGAQLLTLAVDSEPQDISHVGPVLRARAPHLEAVIAEHQGREEFFTMFSKSWRGTIPATFVFDRAGKLRRAYPEGADLSALSATLDGLLRPGAR